MPTPLLSEYEKLEVTRMIRKLIESSGQTATLLRKQEGENLYGIDEGIFTDVCVFPLEIIDAPSVDIGRKIDASASVLPEFDVKTVDRIRFEGVEYRVQSITEEFLFGVVTHMVLELVKLHGS